MAAVASASTTQSTSRLNDEQELKEFCDIVWGPNIRLDVFQRWSQGLLSFVYPQTLHFHAQHFQSIGANSDKCLQLFTHKILILIQWHLWPWIYIHLIACISSIKTFFLISTGFEFSEYEPSALVQRQGGPCAVIAPVQAYLLKTLLSEANSFTLSDVSTICT